jgi:hypothetical protein
MRKAFSFEPMRCESAGRRPEDLEWRYKLKLDAELAPFWLKELDALD